MRIRINGNPSIERDELRDAARFYAYTLIKNEGIVSELNLSVRFKPQFRKRKKTFAELERDHREKPKFRTFYLDIAQDLSRRLTLIALAHEVVHIKQFVTRELVPRFDDGVEIWKWKGKDFYDEMNMDYYDEPWEVDAFGREKGLYERFIEYKRRA